MARRKPDPKLEPEYVYELARKRVRVLLAEQGLTPQQMADEVGMSRAALYDRIRIDWTSSKGAPQPRFQLHEVKAISARYGVSEAEFFNEGGFRVVREEDGPSRSGRNKTSYSGESVIASGRPPKVRASA